MQETVARISLNVIVRNAALVLKKAGVPLIAVVKDDAYGHGAERVSLALEPIVYAFAVATAGEGAALRTAGVKKEIFVLTPCLNGEEALRCAAYDLIPSVASRASMELLLRAAERFGRAPRIELAVNTGMNRYGFRPERARSAARSARAAGLEVAGVFSHFYAPEDEEAREAQYALFLRASSEVKELCPAAIRHLSATGGILAGKRYNFDAVRSGIALYGYLPQGFEGKLPVKPALRLYANVAQSGRFTGGGAGYARAERQYGALHTLRLGYGDGLFRAGGPGIGKLCMDACICTGAAPFGGRRRAIADIGEYARAHGTTEYEVLVNITKKAVRVYV